ncbi:MAG: EAL domain-containing protein [Proteobacteria bacterium]|nr:EAL domain-containing protein [Pseudomonadota bacterium]
MEPTSGNGKQDLKRYYSGQNLNSAFTAFLDIRTSDKILVRSYYDVLLEGDEQFARIFYNYLLQAPETKKVLDTYAQTHSSIDELIRTQLDHFRHLLSADTSADYTIKLEHIGKTHHDHNIEPVWIMGGYLLYLEHLQDIVRHNRNIVDQARETLEDSITKLLFRDMGLLLEGYWNASLSQINEQKQQVSELQERINSVLGNIPHLLWSVDPSDNSLVYISPNTHHVCGHDHSMPIPCMEWTISEDRPRVEFAWQQVLAGNPVEVESRIRNKNGEIRWLRRVFHPCIDENKQVIRIDGLMEDTTDAKLAVERLHTMATTDGLTGLLNRTLFYDRLHQALTRPRRNNKHTAALLLMDLDHFKEINDTLGHPAGDLILIEAAKRMRASLRDSDSLARLGGDEFAVLIPTDADGAAIEKVADKIQACFEAPFLYEQSQLYLGVSIGVACYPENGVDADTLMSRADVAMYANKGSGTSYCYYSSEDDPNTQERLQLASELRDAIKEQQLELYYQPKIGIHSKKITGTEALIRWNHPDRGTLEPAQFLPLAERCGLIQPITEWVLGEAAQQCRRWQDKGYRIPMAINLSTRAFQNPDLIHDVRDALKRSKITPALLEIEITENELMADIDYASDVLQSLSDLGIRIAIDDFGTGYSSLAYLKQLPLDTLKIDKSFVINLTRNDNDAVIVRSIIDLAHNLGRQVVAEGIEQKDVWDMLHQLGCDDAQGYYISHPLPAIKLEAWLQSSPWQPLFN